MRELRTLAAPQGQQWVNFARFSAPQKAEDVGVCSDARFHHAGGMDAP
jgi:hypothetical protein